MPLALVIAVAVVNPLNVAAAPEAGAAKVTVTPLTALLFASLTVACSGVAKRALIIVLWGVPPVALMLAGAPARLLRLKLAGVEIPGVLASGVHVPACPLAVSAGAVAMPLASVTAVAVPEPLKVPLAPLAGAVNVTAAPLIGLLLASFTVTCKGLAKAVPIVVLWGVPALAVMLGPFTTVTAAPFKVTLPEPAFICQITIKFFPEAPA